MSQKKTKKPITQNMNIFAFLNNIVIAGMSKGQLLPILSFIIIFTLILKLPDDKVYEILDKMLSHLKSGHLLGYALFGIETIGFVVYIKAIRRSTSGEFKRIGIEKSNLQNKLLNGQARSSDK